MKFFATLIVSSLAVSGGGWSTHAIEIQNISQAQRHITPEIHKLCLDAKDYAGCIKARGLVDSQEMKSINQDPYWFDERSVKQLRVKGEYGRYIVFQGRTIFNAYDYGWGSASYYGSAWGNSGTVSGTGFGSGFSVNGTVRSGAFTYHLDCVDGTADRLGDASYAQEDTAGWFPVIKDPTAQEVFSKYCPKINELPLSD